MLHNRQTRAVLPGWFAVFLLAVFLALVPARASSEDFTIDENGVLTKYNGPGGDVTIPDGVTSIGEEAFSGYSSLSSVTIPNSVTEIGEEAFAYCSNLPSVTIPDGVTSIGRAVFAGCTSLREINASEGNQVYSSADGVLFNKNKTTLVHYPEGKQETTYSIPISVTSIGMGAFYQCKRLSGVTIPNSVTEIGVYAFYECSSLPSVTIPNSVTSIGNGAFFGCSSLPSVTIPNSVTEIGLYPFEECSSLREINVTEGNQAYSSANGVLFNKDKTTLILYPEGKQETTYSIPTSVTSIDDSAFGRCNSLSSVTIPNSVTSIGSSAFNHCKSLSNVTIPNSVTSISSFTFQGCSSLSSVTIPGSVTSIGLSAFESCRSLTDVYYSGSKAQWNAVSIGSLNTPLKDATIHYQSLPVDVRRVTESQAELVLSNAMAGTCYVALYNTNGKILTVGMEEVPANAGEVTVSYSPVSLPAGGYTVKVMLLNNEMAPLYVAYGRTWFQ